MGLWAAAFGVGFLLGSIPAAWLLVRIVLKKDIGREGSSNVGAMNAMKVSRSRWLGISVLILDLLKGGGSVWIAMWLATLGDVGLLSMQGAGALGAIAGHNYNPWLSIAARALRGGKGYAAAAGAFLVFIPWLVVVWLGVALVGWYVLKKTRGISDEAPASFLATLCMIPGAWLIYGSCPAIIAACFVLIVLPKQLGELRTVLSKPAA